MKKLDYVFGFFLTLCEKFIEAIVPVFYFLCLLASAILAMTLVLNIVSIVEIDTMSDAIGQLKIGALVALVLGVGYWLIVKVFRIRNWDFLFFVKLGFYGGYYCSCMISACGLIGLFAADKLSGIGTLIGLALAATLALCPQAVKKLKRR